MNTTRYIQNEVRHLNILKSDHRKDSGSNSPSKKDIKSALIPISKKYEAN